MTAHFKRPDLAKRMVDELCGKVGFSDAPNGLFLAAARRTGKSDFLQQDLMPALKDAGVFVSYLDLWAKSDMAPTELLATKLALDVQETQGWVAQVGTKTGLKTFGIPGTGVTFDFSKVGKTGGVTLHETLAMLRKQTGKRIALIIDEAQHALTSAEGETFMRALKSAREQMKEKDGSGLLLVMSGSHRDKLARLVNTAAAPFWGSEVQALPTLGAAYALHVARELERAQPELQGIDHDNLVDAFQRVGERPQFLRMACAQALKQAGSAGAFDAALRTHVQDQRARDRAAMSETFLQLPPLQQAVLERLLAQGKKYNAFSADSLKFYAEKTGEPVTTPQVQNALSDLRERDDRLVWKSSRGDYALYDENVAEWYAYLQNAKQWPLT